jgi:hypothetical protein
MCNKHEKLISKLIQKIDELKAENQELSDLIPCGSNSGKTWYYKEPTYKFSTSYESIETCPLTGRSEMTVIRQHEIDLNDNESYFIQGVLHSEQDHWSRKLKNGTLQWHKNGELHRIGHPAVVYPNGEVEYWEYGVQIEAPFNFIAKIADFFISYKAIFES